MTSTSSTAARSAVYTALGQVLGTWTPVYENAPVPSIADCPLVASIEVVFARAQPGALGVNSPKRVDGYVALVLGVPVGTGTKDIDDATDAVQALPATSRGALHFLDVSRSGSRLTPTGRHSVAFVIRFWYTSARP